MGELSSVEKPWGRVKMASLPGRVLFAFIKCRETVPESLCLSDWWQLLVRALRSGKLFPMMLGASRSSSLRIASERD